MEPVRRPSDGELCGYVERSSEGAWRALTVFGGTLAKLDTHEAAIVHVLEHGLDALAERWTLVATATGDEQVVCIQEANDLTVTLALDYYPMPGVPTMTLRTEQLRSGEWGLHRQPHHVE